MESWNVNLVRGSTVFSPSSHILPNREAVDWMLEMMHESMIDDYGDWRIEITAPDGSIEIRENEDWRSEG